MEVAGAPIANAISFNLIAIATLAYGIFFVPHTAWHPLSMRAFKSLGVLVQLGLAGVGISLRACTAKLQLMLPYRTSCI
jgi:hypothetical protein